MILPEVNLQSYKNQQFLFSGLDSAEHALNKNHFKNYPYDVVYQYNSRGFRDSEWPDSVDNAIWCIGDSFTVGLGCPMENTWPHILSKQTNKRTINVSMDGASNEWIARQARNILDTVFPQTIVIQWSYVSRRELPLSSALEEKWQNFYNNVRDKNWPMVTYLEKNTLPNYIQQELVCIHGFSINKFEKIPDEHRRLSSIKSDISEDIEFTIECIKSLHQWESTTQIVHSFVPDFLYKFQENNLTYYRDFFEKIEKNTKYCIESFPVLDIARDGHHYDLLTAQNFVSLVTKQLKNTVSLS